MLKLKCLFGSKSKAKRLQQKELQKQQKDANIQNPQNDIYQIQKDNKELQYNKDDNKNNFNIEDNKNEEDSLWPEKCPAAKWIEENTVSPWQQHDTWKEKGDTQPPWKDKSPTSPWQQEQPKSPWQHDLPKSPRLLESNSPKQRDEPKLPWEHQKEAKSNWQHTDNGPPSPPVPLSPTIPIVPDPPAPESLQPCDVCGRTFLPESLGKHVKICEKMAFKKRKTFDSFRQRREGTDLAQYLPKNFGLPEHSPFLEKSPPPTSKIMPKPKPATTRTTVIKQKSELERCPQCGRAFGARAYERHVEWCEDRAKLVPPAPAPPPPQLAQARHRLNARTNYKAPPVRTRRSLTREKGSHSRSASVESNGMSPSMEYPASQHNYGTPVTHSSRNRKTSDSVSSVEMNDDNHIPVIRNNSRGNVGSGEPARHRQARLARDLNSNGKVLSQDIPDENTCPKPSTSKELVVVAHKSKTSVKKILTKEQIQINKLEQISDKYHERVARIENDVKYCLSSDKISVECISSEKSKKTNYLKKGKSTVTNINPKVTNENYETEKQPSKLIRSKTAVKSKSDPILADTNPEVSLNVQKVIVDNKFDKSLNKPALKSTRGQNIKKCVDKHMQATVDLSSVSVNTDAFQCMICEATQCILHESGERPKKRLKKNLSKPKGKSGASKTNAKNEGFQFKYNPVPLDILYVNQDLKGENAKMEELFKPFSSEGDISKRNVNSEPSLLIVNELESTFLQNNVKQNSIKKNLAAIENYIESVSVENDIEKVAVETENDCLPTNHKHGSCECDIERVQIELKKTPKLNIYENNDKYAENTPDNSSFQKKENNGDKNLSKDLTQLEFLEAAERIFNESLEHVDVIDNYCEDIKNNNEDFSRDENKSAYSELVFDAIQMNFGHSKSTDKQFFMEKMSETEIKLGNNQEKIFTSQEYISVYELETESPFTSEAYETKSSPILKSKRVILRNSEQDVKLPSISESNIPIRSKPSETRLDNTRKAFKYVNEMNDLHCHFKTLVLEDNFGCVVPDHFKEDLFLPKIRNQRHDANYYDPFLSAEKQMKELMASDTDIAKRSQPKDSNKTLPVLRHSKERSPLAYARNDYTKSTNTPKTPTLQRMKSFSSSNNNNNVVSSGYGFGQRCSSLRLSKNVKKPTPPKLDTTFIKQSSKENINHFNRSSNFNRSFSDYNTSSYRKENKFTNNNSLMYQSYQRNSNKINTVDKVRKSSNGNLNKTVVIDDNLSIGDEEMNYIDERLINKHDNLPITINTILNNPNIIGSMESVLNSEHLPDKFESFKVQDDNISYKNSLNNQEKEHSSVTKSHVDNVNNEIKSNQTFTPTVDDLSAQYDRIMSSLEQSIASKASIRDDDSLCEDFDLEEFMTSFDEELHKQKLLNSTVRTGSSTTRIINIKDRLDSKIVNKESKSKSNTPKSDDDDVKMIPFIKSTSMIFSHPKSIPSAEPVFPSSMRRSSSHTNPFQKTTEQTEEVRKTKYQAYRSEEAQLERDIMLSLKDFNKFCDEGQASGDGVDWQKCKRDLQNIGHDLNHETSKENSKHFEKETEHSDKSSNNSNQVSLNSKASSDSAYSSLNRSFQNSKTSLPVSKEKISSKIYDKKKLNNQATLIQKEELLDSSDEFLAIERSAETLEKLSEKIGHETPKLNDKRSASRQQLRTRNELSSSSSESSLPPLKGKQETKPAPTCSNPLATLPLPRFSKFCHECGSKFPVDTAKFCIDCGAKRLLI